MKFFLIFFYFLSFLADNRRKQKRFNSTRQNNLDFIRFNAQLEDDHVKVLAPSPQILLATYQFLISSKFPSLLLLLSHYLFLTLILCVYKQIIVFSFFLYILFAFSILAVEPFRPEHVSEEVLKLLLKKDIYFRADGEAPQINLENLRMENVLYRSGVPSNDFIMILEGRARVVCTNEQQEYEAGPFCFFGKTCLMDNISEKRNKRKASVDECKFPFFRLFFFNCKLYKKQYGEKEKKTLKIVSFFLLPLPFLRLMEFANNFVSFFSFFFFSVLLFLNILTIFV